ncbi:hypothetical protein CBL_14255 [Carabus blaptoides fortunei]
MDTFLRPSTKLSDLAQRSRNNFCKKFRCKRRGQRRILRILLPAEGAEVARHPGGIQRVERRGTTRYSMPQRLRECAMTHYVADMERTMLITNTRPLINGLSPPPVTVCCVVRHYAASLTLPSSGFSSHYPGVLAGELAFQPSPSSCG